jgi:ubiquinone biosynthesis protein
MRGPHNIWRLVRTGATLRADRRDGRGLEAMDAPPLRVAARVLGWPFKWLGYKGDPKMPPAPRALTALGPAYIKFGQILSTRPDVVGDELATELRVLQDKLPPFPTGRRRARMIEARAGAAARRAVFGVLRTGRRGLHRAGAQGAARGTGADVAVKVLRPGDRARVPQGHRRLLPDRLGDRDTVARLPPPAAARRDRAFRGRGDGELDLRLESSAAGEFAANTEGRGFRGAAVEWFLSSRRVMTLAGPRGSPWRRRGDRCGGP